MSLTRLQTRPGDVCLAEISTLILMPGLKDIPAWINKNKGLYHLAGSGRASRFEFSQTVLGFDPHPEEQKVKEMVEALTREFPSAADRPVHSALNCDKFVKYIRDTAP